MQKKIGDVTVREILKHHEKSICKDCKFNLTGLCRIACIIKCETLEDMDYLDQEIEVEEDE